MTTKTERVLRYQLVAWCPDHREWFGSYGGPGEPCFYDGCPRILVARRRWVCAGCLCSYKTRKEAETHVCNECY